MSEPMAILTDVTRCTGCEKCVDACKDEYELGEDRPWRGQSAIDDLSASRYTTIVNKPGNHHVRQQCRHCLEPACVSACIVGALQKTPEGPVIYDAKKCIGCRYCLMSCPFDIPRYDWDRAVPYVRKCTMCYDRHQTTDPKRDAGHLLKGCPGQIRKRLVSKIIFPRQETKRNIGDHQNGCPSDLMFAVHLLNIRIWIVAQSLFGLCEHFGACAKDRRLLRTSFDTSGNPTLFETVVTHCAFADIRHSPVPIITGNVKRT